MVKKQVIAAKHKCQWKWKLVSLEGINCLVHEYVQRQLKSSDLQHHQKQQIDLSWSHWTQGLNFKPISLTLCNCNLANIQNRFRH